MKLKDLVNFIGDVYHTYVKKQVYDRAIKFNVWYNHQPYVIMGKLDGYQNKFWARPILGQSREPFGNLYLHYLNFGDPVPLDGSIDVGVNYDGLGLIYDIDELKYTFDKSVDWLSAKLYGGNDTINVGT